MNNEQHVAYNLTLHYKSTIHTYQQALDSVYLLLDLYSKKLLAIYRSTKATFVINTFIIPVVDHPSKCQNGTNSIFRELFHL